MNAMCSQGGQNWTFPVLLVLLFATYSSMANDFEKVEELYNESLAYWNFEEIDSTNSIPAVDITDGFCQIEGIHGENSFAASLKQPTDDHTKSAKITLSSYGSSNCPTDPLACEEGFTVAFWLSLQNSTTTKVKDDSNCMLLSLNDTSHSGFQFMLKVSSSTVTSKALGTEMESAEAFNATNNWIWNHLGLTWNNKTSTLMMYINGELSVDKQAVSTYPMTTDQPLADGGCDYTALDEIAMWTRPLNDDEMMILRLDRFNETDIMTTTQQETTTEEVTTPETTTTMEPTTSPTTTDSTTMKLTTFSSTFMPTSKETSAATTAELSTTKQSQSTAEAVTTATPKLLMPSTPDMTSLKVTTDTPPTITDVPLQTTDDSRPTTRPLTSSPASTTSKIITQESSTPLKATSAQSSTPALTTSVQSSTPALTPSAQSSTRVPTTNKQSSTPMTTSNTTRISDFTLPDAVSKVEGTNNTEELIDTLQFVHEYLAGYQSPSNDIVGADRKNIKSILDIVPTKIPMLDNSTEAQRILEKYMAIVNDVLEINKDFANQEKMLLSGFDLANAVDSMLSSYINTVPVGDKLVKNTFVDTTLSKPVTDGSDITMKLQQCRDNCGDYDIIVVIPSAVFADSQTKKQASASTFYEGVKKHLPKSIPGDKTEYRIASFLVGINVNVPSTSSLSAAITLSVSVGELNSSQDATCVFLDENGGWSKTGVSSVMDIDNKVVNCSSNHLTNFAVLVSTRQLDISVADTLALEILTNVGLAISITCLLLTVIILNALRQLSSTRISILKHTAAALLIAQILFIVGSSLAGSEKGLCTAIAALLHYFFLAVFCWMLIQGVQLYMKVRRALKGNIDMVYFCVFGWGFPAIVVGISVGISYPNYNGESGVCWISVKEGVSTLIAFIGPAYLILAINLVVLCMVMHVFLTVKVNKDKSEMDKLKSGLKAVVVMVPILGVTWFFGLFIIISPEVVFLYLFVIFNSSQGLLMFLFHVVFNDEVKQAMIKKRNKIAASKDSNSLFSKAVKSKSDQTTTEATMSTGNQ